MEATSIEFLQKWGCRKNSRFIKAESMTYSRYQQLKPEDFKRLCGVHHQTFVCMVAVLEEQVEQKKKKQGLPSKLSVADQVFMSLEY